MHKKLKKSYDGTTNLRKRAKTRVRVVTDIQNFALRAHCVGTACALRAWHSHNNKMCSSTMTLMPRLKWTTLAEVLYGGMARGVWHGNVVSCLTNGVYRNRDVSVVWKRGVWYGECDMG